MIITISVTIANGVLRWSVPLDPAAAAMLLTTTKTAPATNCAKGVHTVIA